MIKIIFFDTDCISSFLWTKSEYLLVDCFGNNMVIPVQVYNELSKIPNLKLRTDELISSGDLSIEDIIVGSEENKLYFELINYNEKSTLPLIGRGEAAAIVLAKSTNGILASNNFKDVKYYVELYNLDHISTSDIIHQAVKKGILTTAIADEIWIKMIEKRRKLPFNSFTEYLNNK